MKKYLIQIASATVVCCARGQVTLQYDQQVGDLNAPGGGYDNIIPQPTGQSFVPNLSSADFVQIYLTDATVSGVGATMSMDLWSGSLATGTLISQSDSVALGASFHGLVQFDFPTPAAVTPGTTYYFQPIIQSGDFFEVGEAPGLGYANGNATFGGVASPADLWFREGIFVPEPSSFILTFFGATGIWLYRRKA